MKRNVLNRFPMGWLRPWIALAALLAASGARGEAAAQRVVIVANSAVPGSEEIARHYARARGVPEANVIVLEMPDTETVGWKAFIAKIWNPLEAELVRRGWIDAVAMDLYDPIGRRVYVTAGHHIAALITCRGVPLRVENDPALYREVGVLTRHAEFRTNQGAVDSELSLLAQPGYPINASVPNPLFGQDTPGFTALAQVVKVSRLDGPTVEDALHLVDRAMQAERDGLLGRAYVDIAGPVPAGNKWLESVAASLAAAGFDTSVSRGPSTLAARARIDAPALYFGWYAPDLNGPFAPAGFRSPPGAIALHIHSFSAHTLRSPSEAWCGPLLARGATATLGNVYEPYLELTHRPDLLVQALLRGHSLVDAAFYSLPVLSWQSVLVGDPLYRPFARPLDDQLGRLGELPPSLAGYAVVRAMLRLEAAGQPAAALQAGLAGMREAPNLPLALFTARGLDAAGRGDEALDLVEHASAGAPSAPDTWSLLHEASVYLETGGRTDAVRAVSRKLAEDPALPEALRAAWVGGSGGR